MQQIYSSFGFKNSGKNNSVELTSRERRQVFMLATITITSLVTYFSTKELVEMSVAVGDELVDTSNHIIQASQSHENRISRIEEQEKQLKTHQQNHQYTKTEEGDYQCEHCGGRH